MLQRPWKMGADVSGSTTVLEALGPAAGTMTIYVFLLLSSVSTAPRKQR